MPELYILTITVPLILFSLVMHELAHGLVSYKLGDPTPKQLGRLTLNPFAHLDPFGTLMLIVTVLKGFGFGWAKPVPVDPGYYKNPLKGSVLVALAGPVVNLGLAFFFGLPLRFSKPGWGLLALKPDLALFLFKFCSTGLLLNLSLAFFNLLPIPPLDGSRLVRYFLRGQAVLVYDRIEHYGFLILFVLLFFFAEAFNRFFSLVLSFGVSLITGL